MVGCAALKTVKVNKLNLVQLHNLEIQGIKSKLAKIRVSIAKLKKSVSKKDKKADQKDKKAQKDPKKELKKLRRQRTKLLQRLASLKQVHGESKKKAFRLWRRFLIRRKIVSLKGKKRALKSSYRKTKQQLAKANTVAAALKEGSTARAEFDKKSKALAKSLLKLKIKISKLEMRITNLILKHAQNENVILIWRVRLIRLQ